MMTCYDACLDTYNFQINKLLKFLNAIHIKVKEVSDDDVDQLFAEFSAIKLFCIYDLYLRSIIHCGAAKKEKQMIKYFNSITSDKNKKIHNTNDLIIRLNSLSLYEKKCKKLKTIIREIFNFDIFPDSVTENFFLDLVLIRNVIIHNGGFIESNHVKQLHNTDVVEKTSNFEEPLAFYKLNIPKSNFKTEIIKALHTLIFHIHNNLRQIEPGNY